MTKILVQDKTLKLHGYIKGYSTISNYISGTSIGLYIWGDDSISFYMDKICINLHSIVNKNKETEEYKYWI